MLLATKQFIDNAIGTLLVAVNLPLARLFGWLLKRNHSVEKPPKNILVIKILGLGSVILASDALQAIRKKYPQAKMILLCSKSVKAGIEPLGLFDDIWTTHDKNFFTLAGSAINILWQSWKLKDLWVIDLEVYSKLTTIFSLWTLARNRFGFQLNQTHFRNNLNTHNIYFNQFCAVEDNYFEIAKAMGVQQKESFYFPNFHPEGRQNEAGKKYIAINNTCSELGRERLVPDEILAEVCEWILKNTDYKIALLGGPADWDANHFFVTHYMEKCETQIDNIAGKKSFAEYFSFLYDNCALMISVDSAPVHIARKLGMPTLSLWGPTNPHHRISKQELESGRHLVLYLSVHCSPCIHHTELLPCGGNNFCMKGMEAAHICNRLKMLLQNIEHNQHAPLQ
ncbi:MAG: glycosyltransferase family 9 protein [Bacteroidia bacterium]